MKSSQPRMMGSSSGVPEEECSSSAIGSRNTSGPSPLSVHMPWLMLPSLKADRSVCTFYVLSEGHCCPIGIPRLYSGSCYGVFRGWLLIGDDFSKECLLLNPISGAVKELPRWWSDEPMGHVAMSSSPADPDCVVSSVLANHVVFCRPGDPLWSVCFTAGYGPHMLSSTDYAFCDRKFYCLRSWEWLMVVDILGGSWCTHLLLNCRILPRDERYRYNFLVELNGELLLVTAFDDWTSCKVFRADLRELKWVAVESLAEYALFLGRGCSVAVKATVAGVHGNRIYISFPPFMAVAERERRWGANQRWFWAVFVVGFDGGGVKYAPPIDTEAFNREPCHWFVPNP